jgi:hypothetical protein
MMNDTTPPRWIIDPATLGLKPEDGSEHPGPFTAQDWAKQIWPDCPVCGCTINVARVDATSSWSDPAPVFLMGRWECPNHCDPRPALRGQP